MKLRAKLHDTGQEAQNQVGSAVQSFGREAGRGPSPAARNLALAHHLHRLIDQGEIADYTEAARMLGVSQPRMTHVMSLLLLAPAIQEAILMAGDGPREKELRDIARLAHWEAQERRLTQLGRRQTGRQAQASSSPLE